LHNLANFDILIMLPHVNNFLFRTIYPQIVDKMLNIIILLLEIKTTL